MNDSEDDYDKVSICKIVSGGISLGLRLKVILNPSSGRETARTNIEDVLALLSMRGEIDRADIYYTHARFDAKRFAEETDTSDYDCIVAAGGDGTVNEVVTGLMCAGIDIPVAIYTSGTVNDFARINDLPQTPAEFAKMLLDFNTRRVDCGRVEDMYFLNVLAGGVFTDVGYSVPSDLKTAFGPAAYWLSAMKDIQEMNETIPLEIKKEDGDITADALMFFVSNTKSVGGFRNLMSQADVTDGLLDVMIIRKVDYAEIMPLLGKLMIGEHINSDKVIYFQSKGFRMEAPGADKPVTLDLDGEEGPDLPIEIECMHSAINLVVPKEEIEL